MVGYKKYGMTLSLLLLMPVISTAQQKTTKSVANHKTENTMNTKWLWKSAYSAPETLDRLLKILDKYPEVLQYSRIDQQKVAAMSGENIRPVECVFFQNSKLVGKILQANIEAAAELPIKAMVWEDKHHQVWIKTTDIDALNEQYHLNGADGAIKSIHELLPE